MLRKAVRAANPKRSEGGRKSQVPNAGADPYAQLAVDMAESEEEKAAARAKLEVAPPSVLNLDYRQDTDLPQLKCHFVRG